ncbi:hypothetical protein JYT72_00110 [Crocinitomix catalasitica]|nr:hypothetical protein [Crocinitomix catalasitica]
MSIREKLRNPFVQQYAIEILFPILGFYVFDWDLLIILVFYWIDQLSAELLFFRRLFVINTKSQHKVSPFFLLEPILVFFIIFALQIYGVYYICSLDFSQLAYFGDEVAAIAELIKFSFEELWLLFPLIIAVYYLKDLFTFYMPRRYLLYSRRRTISFRHLFNLSIFIGVCGFFLIMNKINGNEHLALFSFIVLKVIYDFTLMKWINRKSLLDQ